MDMAEVVEESTMGSSDQGLIVKGKRTKRPRPASPLMASSSSSTPTTSESTEEEDMANCLILLAQGHSGHNSKRTEGNYSNTYECKTCNRCFPSFQALGGHRASHKKPRSNCVTSSDESQLNNNSTSPPNNHQYDHLQMCLQRGGYNSGSYRAKVHECSICGSEFSSGQALGGHMRRHRATITTNATVTSDPQRASNNNKQSRNVLALDLNLPAPEDDPESKLSFASKQQPLVFSASALVDCHY